MANPLSRKRGPHAADCTLGKPAQWFAQQKIDPNRSGWCSCGNNPLDQEDFIRMNLPRPLWGTSLEAVTASVRERVSKYLQRIHKARREGISLYVFGAPGTGKTGVASVVLKEARAWGYTAFYISVERLREAYKERAAFDSEMSVWERSRTVDFLVLDDLRESDARERDFTIHDIRGLVLARNDKGLVTITTSLVPPGDWRDKGADGIVNALQQSCAILEVVGEDRHEKSQATKNTIFD